MLPQKNMGWIFTKRRYKESIRDFFEREFNYQKEDGRYGKIIDCAIVNLHTAYIAYETNASGKKEVVALVCLLQFNPKARDGYNFGYKDMDETMGPYQCDCPERILKLLTPTDYEYAKKWREKCWENIRKRETRPQLKKGMVIEFAKPITFDGWGERSVFKVIDLRQLVFESDSKLFKLRRSTLQHNEWKIVQ